MQTKTRGFTLLELLVVIAIIGLLSSIVLASLKGVRAKGNDSKRYADMHSIVQALSLYANDHGQYPPSPGVAGGCGATGTCLDDLTALTSGNYISSLPHDPNSAWDGTGNNYRYCGNAHGYVLLIRTEAAHPTTWCRPQVPIANNTACPSWNTSYVDC